MDLEIQTGRNNLLRVNFMKQIRWNSIIKIAVLFPALVATLMLSGCCVNISTSVRNETDENLILTHIGPFQQFGTVIIRAHSTRRCDGILPAVPGKSPDSWIITDGQSQFTYTNVSPIASMPDKFVSSSRFTSEFPCNRFTRHVAITPDMAIHAVRVIGYTESEPSPFPIHYTKKESEK